MSETTNQQCPDCGTEMFPQGGALWCPDCEMEYWQDGGWWRCGEDGNAQRVAVTDGGAENHGAGAHQQRPCKSSTTQSRTTSSTESSRAEPSSNTENTQKTQKAQSSTSTERSSGQASSTKSDGNLRTDGGRAEESAGDEHGSVFGYEMLVECPDCGFPTSTREISNVKTVDCGEGYPDDQGCGKTLSVEVSAVDGGEDGE